MLPLPAGRDASAGAARYTRHRPERTLLYQLVREYYPAFTAQLAAQGSFLPSYVEREFEAYLKVASSTASCGYAVSVAMPSSWSRSVVNAGGSAPAAPPGA